MGAAFMFAALVPAVIYVARSDLAVAASLEAVAVVAGASLLGKLSGHLLAGIRLVLLRRALEQTLERRNTRRVHVH
jgi:hypothetical protein